MRITLDLRKSLEKNAQVYFEKSKKAKKKLEGAEKALAKSRKKLKKIETLEVEKPKELKERVKKRDWFEKFRWFVSSDGFLVIGGRDASSNEIVIKKHSDPKDVVFHTDMAGSPFVVVKANNEEVPETTLKEAADFTLAYSRAWRQGLTTSSVFYVKPDQVSKKAKAGEALPRGAFMIYGETNYVDTEMNFAVGVVKEGDFKGRIMAGPVSAIENQCEPVIKVVQGRKKTSEVAKALRKEIGGDLDDIIRLLPAGGVEVSS